MNKIRWPAKTVFFVSIVILVILAKMNMDELGNSGAVIYLLPVILIVPAVYFLLDKVKTGQREFLAVLFSLSFLFKGLLVVFLKTEPISDFNLFWNAARDIANARTDYLQLEYFKIWSYQTGIVTYYAGLVKLFGEHLMPVQIMNCLWAAMTNVLVYLLAKKVARDTAARTVAILYLLYPEPYFLCSTLSNQMLGDLLLCAAVYVFFMKRNSKNAIAAGIIAALGNAVRPTGTVLIIAFVFFSLIEFRSTENNTSAFSANTGRNGLHMRKPTGEVIFSPVLVTTDSGASNPRLKTSLAKVWGNAAVAISSYLILGVVLSSLVIYSGLNPNGLKNDFPLYKFVVGLNQETYGGYSEEDAGLTRITDKNQRDAVSLNLIRERLQASPSVLYNFFKIKTENMWAAYDTLGWSFFRLAGGDIGIANIKISFEAFSNFVLRLEKSFYILMLALTSLSCVVCMKRKQAPPELLFGILVFLIYFAMLEFVEIQVRYRYFAMIYLFIISSRSLELIKDRKRKK